MTTPAPWPRLGSWLGGCNPPLEVPLPVALEAVEPPVTTLPTLWPATGS